MRSNKHRLLKFAFGVGIEWYEAQHREQGGVCAVCKQPETVVDNRTRQPKNLAVDHNHKTGRIRGLLCSLCNRAAGAVRDDPATARALAAYLEHYAQD